jgi:RNA polymerase sigma-70 factor (ECF subfamily)
LHIVQQQEMSACVQRYVECLSDSARTVLLLHDANGLTAPEIANLLDLPLTTVKIRLHRARHLLQRELEKACTFRPDDRGVFVCEPK